MNEKYYIYDHYNEQWINLAFLYFEDAENYIEELIEFRNKHEMPCDFAIYKKIL